MASVVKMRGTEVGQKVTELAVEAVGWYGTPFTELRNYDSNVVPVGGEYVDDVSPRYFNTRKTHDLRRLVGGPAQRPGQGDAGLSSSPRAKRGASSRTSMKQDLSARACGAPVETTGDSWTIAASAAPA